MSSTADAVRRYYDQNTRLFLRFGSDQNVASIHRALWLPGTQSLAQALDVSHQRLASEVQALAAASPQPLRVLDLGCGVGATLAYLLRVVTTPLQAEGVTLSPVQAQLAQARLTQLGFAGRANVIEASYLDLPVQTGVDLAYAIESFIHSPDPARFFSEAARVVRPGGRLIMLDDVLDHDGPSAWLNDYRRGWHANSVLTSTQIAQLASGAGWHLRENIDLSAQLRLRALPTWLAAALLAIGRRLPNLHAMIPSMVGSIALQQALRDEELQYRWMVFERLTQGP